AEIRIKEEDCGDAATGDTVQVKVLRKPARPDQLATGRVVRVVERSTHQFVGTYFTRDGEGRVRVDGTVFAHSIGVGDPGAKGARPGDKVVFEMVRFPSAEDHGEGVLTEVLGPAGQPGVDTLSVIRAYGLPDAFPEDALEEARKAAAAFREDDLDGREDFTKALVATIDPIDARDFDDAVGLTRDANGHWELSVHIADVGRFAPPGGALDREARKRATSVYLPGRVIPMFPEVVSNHLASLQPGRVRYVKSAIMGFTPEGAPTSVRFADGAIRSARRFHYAEALEVLERGEPKDDLERMLLAMKELAMLLRGRRKKRGSLELSVPKAELEYDDQGRVSGAHFAPDDASHQLIEEFMLAANEAVARKLDQLKVAFLRRVHPAPDPLRMQAFSRFARSLGYSMKTDADRFSLQRVLEQSAPKPERHALHYALLRSLKQASYSPLDEEHYALASEDYCHFTSPIRRYPDLTIHRQLGQWLRSGKPGGDMKELLALGDHCSKMEKRAEAAERELVKLKLLAHMEGRLGQEMDAIITGVSDYGFFAQGELLPVEGLVHVSTLPDDFYHYDEDTHSLEGRRTRRTFQLGQRVRVAVARVDVGRRQLDFRLIRQNP
ncbi:MAG: VacB/RNase II family 3'-5' exoribonuclease, partial [Gemmataceae bacterium]|nr:VacB/RNase II family 3'-5' exoribonuclease [Gemmataceae bacterium]